MSSVHSLQSTSSHLSPVSQSDHQFTMKGMKALFPEFTNTQSVEDRVIITVRRHRHNYFVGLSDAELQDISPDLRPLQPVSEADAKANIYKSERLHNRKLAWVWAADYQWAEQFRQDVRDGSIKSITAAKTRAQQLWRDHSTTYDNARATQAPNETGRGHQVKRSRQEDETEAQ